MSSELITWLFTSIGAVGSLACAGFFYLLSLINSKAAELDKGIGANTALIEQRTTLTYVHSQFYTKEVVDTHLKTIERQLSYMGSAIDGIDKKLDKIWEGNRRI